MRQRENELNEDPTLSDVIKFGIENRLVDLHTCMPGTIVSYDPAAQKATVKPDFQRKFRTGESVDLPQIVDVPVRIPRAGKAFIHFPLKEGDKVMLHFVERSIDTWKQEGGVVDPSTESRKHALSDAYVEIGGYPFNDPVAGTAEDILITNDKSVITIRPDGTMRIENEEEELFTILNDLVSAILQAKTNTAAGPQPLVPPTLFTKIQERIAKLKG